MDIRKLITGTGVSTEETPRARKRGKEDRQDTPASQDRVSLSARRLSPEEAASQSAELNARAEKVRLLKEAVRAGTYRPDKLEVARNLLFSDFKPLE